MTWTGRELTSHDGVTYKYNADGLRTSKKLADGKKIEYYYSGNKLVYEHREINYEGNPDGLSMFYTYDDAGNISNIRYIIDSIGYEHNYYPVCNSRGDVVEIYSYYGVLTAKYTYDTWGEILSITDANGNDIQDPMHIGTLNPFRYRGYYYDTETGSYYLQSRYYDPGVKRFFNADSQLSPQTGLTGTNMFVYANNNPTKYSDPDGHLPFLAITGIVGAVAGAIVGGVIAKKAGKNVWAGIGIGAVGGALLGCGFGAGLGIISGAGVTATTGKVIAGLVTLAGDKIIAGVNKVSNAISSIGSKISPSVQSSSKIVAEINNDIINLERVGSALKTDLFHSFPDIVDNYAGFATKTVVNNGGTLYQLSGSWTNQAGSYNGIFEWIVQDGQVVHRMFREVTEGAIQIMP